MLKSRFSSHVFLFLIVFGAVCGTTHAATIWVYGWHGDKIQEDGIDEAVDGDIVMVTSGTYTGEGNVNLNFNGKAIVVRSQSGPSVTIIDCESAPQTRGFTFNNNETNASKLIGFTIRNGNAQYYPVSSGGGIYVGSSPTIENCIIEDCTANVGGGIQVFNGSSVITPVITNCTLIGNTANSHNGGGIMCAKNAQPTITNCTFQSNTAPADAGAIKVTGYTGVDVTIWYCSFYDNDAGHRGGAIFASGPTSIRNCTFVQNHAGYDGAALTAVGDSADVELTRSIIAFNLATGIESGSGATISFSCNDFYENEGGSFTGFYDSTDVDTNTIFEDPLFCDTANDNYYISSYSPCDEDSSKCGLLIGRYNDNCDRCCNLRGDVNNDGSINVGDQTYLLNFMFFGGPPPPCMDEGDVNGDGAINVADLGYLIDFLFFGGNPPPPCP